MKNQFIENFIEIDKALSKKLDPERLMHSRAVAYTAASIAMSYGVADVTPFLLAGILHDCAKYMHGEEFISFCDEHGIDYDDDLRLVPSMLHGPAGAYIAEHEFGVSDPDILNAIKHHTDGRENMSFLEKAIHLADHIEPGRCFCMEPSLEEVRKLAFSDIDKAIYVMDKAIIEYLENKNGIIFKQAYDTVKYFEKIVFMDEGGKGII